MGEGLRSKNQPDEAMAALWCRRAAETGHPEAMLALGQVLSVGKARGPHGRAVGRAIATLPAAGPSSAASAPQCELWRPMWNSL